MSIRSIREILYFHLRKLSGDRFFFTILFLGVVVIQISWVPFSPQFYRLLSNMDILLEDNLCIFSLNTSLLFNFIFIIIMGIGIIIPFMKESLSRENLLFFLSLPFKKRDYFSSLWLFLSLALFGVFLFFSSIYSLILFFHNFFDILFIPRLMSAILFIILFVSFLSFLYLLSENYLSLILFFLCFIASFPIENIVGEVVNSPFIVRLSYILIYPFLPRFHSLIYFSLRPGDLPLLKVFVFFQSLLLSLLYTLLSYFLFRKRIAEHI